MAVPTITSVAPSQGSSGGWTLVEVQGTDFRLPPDPPPTGVVPVPPPTVAVYFGSTSSPAQNVWVASATKVYALTKAHDVGLVAVILQNLDDDGVPIPGEEATASDAYTFVRPNLTAEGIHARVTRTLLQMLKRQVMENVVLTVHTDFDDTPLDGKDTVMLAKLPGLILSGPDTRENRLLSLNEQPEVEGPTGFFSILRVPRTVDLDFTLQGVSDSTIELLNLLGAVEDCFHRTHLLAMQRDPTNPAAGVVEYELSIPADGAFRVTGNPNESNVRTFSGRVLVRGVDIEGLAGVADDLVRERGGQVGSDGATITAERFEAPTFGVGPSRRSRR